MKVFLRKNYQNNYKPQFLENLIKEKNTYLLQTIFGGEDLVDMHFIRKFNEVFRFLLCFIDIYCKYAWVTPLKDEKGITITNAFKKFQINQIENQTK